MLSQAHWAQLERKVDGMAGQCAKEAQEAAEKKINARVDEIVGNWQTVNLSVYKTQASTGLVDRGLPGYVWRSELPTHDV